MGLGKSKLVEEVKFDNFELVDPKSTVIASVKLTRAARGTQATEEEIPAAAPAEAVEKEKEE